MTSLTVDYAPNALGQPKQVGAYATGITYHPNGAVKQFLYGNGIVHTMTPNARRLPDTSHDYNNVTDEDVLHDVYDYDPNGNVVSISDGVAARHRTMGYDELDRLKWADSPMFGGRIDYTYDALDNITTVVGPNRNQRYCYDDHDDGDGIAPTWRLTFIRNGPTTCTTGPAATALEYDDRGNLKQKNSQAYAFDYGNRLRQAVNLEAYRYDGHGRRVLSYSVQGLGNILSMYSQDGALRYQADARRGKAVQNLYLGGSLVAMREMPLTGGTATIKYQHTDALGTPVAVTDANKVVIERSEYEPFGKRVLGSAQDRAGYTGHVEDAVTGLTYMQQRYYDPAIGRFLSVDPVAARPIGDNFNRYWYANNNPYRFTDPDGRETAMFQKEEYRMAQPSGEGAGLIADFLPVIGDIKGFVDFARNPTLANGAAAIVGLAGPLGDAAGKVIKGADHIADAARALPDSATVCRGGACTADRFASGSGVSVDSAGKLQNVSVNSAPGKSVAELSQGIPNKQVGVTTVGDVRKAGGDVVPSPTRGNPDHCTMCGVTPAQAEKLFTPTVRNPNL